jgi:ubiquitin-conjugating enzyme E2 O
MWHGQELSSLTLVTSRIDQLRVGEKVVLKNKEGAPTTTHGREGDPAGFIVVDTMAVKETCTTVDILWQDGVREKVRSTELIPYLNLDESDCW